MAKSPRFISKLSLITFHNILNKNCCSFESLRTIKSQTWFNHGINTDNGKYGTKLINETIVASLAVSGVNRVSKNSNGWLSELVLVLPTRSGKYFFMIFFDGALALFSSITSLANFLLVLMYSK